MKFKIVLRSKRNADGTSPLAIRIAHKKKTVYCYLGKSLQPDQWDGEMVRRNHPEFQTLNEFIWALEKKVKELIKDSEYDLNQLKGMIQRAQLSESKRRRQTIVSFWEDRILELKGQGKFGNAQVCYSGLSRFLTFIGAKELAFEEVTTPFIVNYMNHLLSSGCKPGGASNYLRTFKAIYNEAYNREVFIVERNPFKKAKLSSLKSPKQKKALSKEQFDLLWEKREGLTQQEELARLTFIISVGLRGVNFADLTMFTKRNIQGNKLVYNRSKTGGLFTMEIPDRIKLLLDYVIENYPNGERLFSYVREDIQEGTDAFFKARRRAIKRYNNRLKRVAKVYGIPVALSSYCARHTFANLVQRSGVRIEEISKMLGHKNVEVTQG